MNQYTPYIAFWFTVAVAIVSLTGYNYGVSRLNHDIEMAKNGYVQHVVNGTPVWVKD